MFEYESEVNLEWRDMNNFEYVILDSRLTTNTTSLRRVNQFKSLIFGGNCNGVIGYGRGAADSVTGAFENAKKNMFQNLISINLDTYNTLPKPIRARFHRTEITLLPLANFNSHGHPLYAHII